MLNFEGTPILHSENLILRPYRPEDAEAMFSTWANDPRVTKYLTWPPHESVESTREVLGSWVKGYASDDYLHWGITRDGKLLGDIAMVQYAERSEWCELGYCLGYEYWGQGVMTEAVKSVVGYLFDIVGFHRIGICHAVKNPASGRVAEKAGFTYEGTARGVMKSIAGDEFLDVSRWGKVKE